MLLGAPEENAQKKNGPRGGDYVLPRARFKPAALASPPRL
jgi:hypothetical protein